MLVNFGGGLREDNIVKYITFYICWLKLEDTGHTDRSLSGKSYSKEEKHNKTDHKDAFDDTVDEGFIKWKKLVN